MTAIDDSQLDALIAAERAAIDEVPNPEMPDVWAIIDRLPDTRRRRFYYVPTMDDLGGTCFCGQSAIGRTWFTDGRRTETRRHCSDCLPLAPGGVL